MFISMQVQSFFSPCVKQISECIRKQMQGHRPQVCYFASRPLSLFLIRSMQYLLICGGFGDSPYLKQELRREFKDRGLQVILANESA
jgi:tRNA A37 threonylcarbamoyltransferase TsaD